ncbi:hypothetical protein FACS189496_1100 [Bacilli bacterium]|nr:hypothetical protein FACS189496_1100 [Bacilli bacterium]
MKRAVVFFAVVLAAGLCPVSTFAAGKCEVTITNKTGTLITELIIKESDSDEIVNQGCRLPDKTTIIKDVKRETYYDIILVDDKGHYYGKERCFFKKKKGRLSISSTDFSSQGALDVLKKLLHL